MTKKMTKHTFCYFRKICGGASFHVQIHSKKNSKTPNLGYKTPSLSYATNFAFEIHVR